MMSLLLVAAGDDPCSCMTLGGSFRWLGRV